MNRLIVTLAVLAACSSKDVPDSPEVAAAKAECKQLLAHIVQISPQGKGKDPAEVVANLPIEDIETCVTSSPEARECMAKATDPAGVRKCVPSDAVIACMGKAGKNAEVRAKCWAGDTHAADNLEKK